MSQKRRATIELLLACAAAAGSAWSWGAAHSTVAVAPVLAGEPRTTSVIYDPPLLVLTLLLATIAGVLAVLGIARIARLRRSRG